MIAGWSYQNHGLRPNTLLHESVNTAGMNSKEFWKVRGGTHYSLGGLQTLIVGVKRLGGM